MSAPLSRARGMALAGALRHAAPLRAAVALAACAALGVPQAAHATPCDVIPGLQPPNSAYGVLAISDDSNDRRWTVSQPYWIAVGAIAYDPTDDFDVGVYGYNYNSLPPPCFMPTLGTSTRVAGQTDFVVGDFNHNPYATYVNTVTCYGGHCDGQVRGIQAWRDGDIFYVDSAPVVFTQSNLADRVVKIWDIYLVQGTTYHFRFQPTGDTQPKLLLFRNATGGTFWTGRYGAEFETANCVTDYIAPSTGYYGMVVVCDRYSVNPVSITLAVTTGPACACPGYLADGVPVAIPSGATRLDAGVVDPYSTIWSVGVRSASDWDLYGGDTPAGPDNGCVSVIRRSSVLLPPKADILIANMGATSTSPPDTFAVRAQLFSGPDGATLEASALYGIQANAPSRVGYLGADEVVKTWAALLERDTTYSIRWFPGGDVKLLGYYLQYQPSYLWRSRSDAFLETTASTSFKADSSGIYTFAFAKDDGGIDNYDFALGFCSAARPLTSKMPINDYDFTYPGQFKPYFLFDQQASHWAAACVYGAGGLDWDIAQYGAASGSPWPECLSAAGALSNGVTGVDVIAGDFHYVPAGTWYLHSYRAGVNGDYYGYTEWDSGSGTLAVNTAPVHVSMLANPYADRLWCYEAYLYAGFPYAISLVPAGAASPRALVFENPGAAPYWAPRSAAILSTGGTAPFIPSTTGWHAIVVVNDNESAGSFDLTLTSSVLAADNAPAPTRDELTVVAPNPAHGPLRIDYALARPAQVSFEVIDLAGRLVCRVPASASGAGRWSQVWDGRGAGGQPLAGGVYLLRMRVDGRTVATRKVMRLN